MTQRQQDIFFALLRLAIWQEDRDEKPRSEDVETLNGIMPEEDWKPVLEASMENAVLGLLGPAIEHVPQHQRPSDRQSDTLVMLTLKLDALREEMNRVIVSAFEIAESVGAKPILLKGEGLAALYKKGCHRAVGDIDMYVGEKDFEKVCIAIDKANGLTPDVNAYRAECEHHYHTEHKGVELEIHHCIADKTWDRKAEGLNRWAEQTLASLPCRRIEIEGRVVLLPAVEFDMFYVFQHLCKHVLNEGGGLRQLIDWAMVLHHVYSNKLYYNRKALLHLLQAYDYYQAWQTLSGILHFQFGLPVEEIPFFDERQARKSQSSILQDIITGGNFGECDRDDTAEQLPHGIRRSWLVMWGMIANYRKKRLLFPKMARANILQTFFIGVKCRIKAPKLLKSPKGATF